MANLDGAGLLIPSGSKTGVRVMSISIVHDMSGIRYFVEELFGKKVVTSVYSEMTLY